MAKDWPYAKLTKAASLAGGPEKWVELIKREEFAKGAGAMKKKMAPWIVVATGVGVAGTLLIQKTTKWLENRKAAKEESATIAAEAEAMLISELHQVEKSEEVEIENTEGSI